MVSQDNISLQLAEIALSVDFPTASEALVQTWSKKGNLDQESIEPILLFMEQHPNIDYGMPGALVHFVERFFGNGYEERLVESVARKPTQQIVWMLNRVINGTSSPNVRQKYIKVLKDARLNFAADMKTRKQIDHFLHRLSA